MTEKKYREHFEIRQLDEGDIFYFINHPEQAYQITRKHPQMMYAQRGSPYDRRSLRGTDIVVYLRNEPLPVKK